MHKIISGALLFISLISVSFAAGNPARVKDKLAVCAACHGADGNSQVEDFPRIAGQYEDYLVQALTAYKSGARKNAIMAAQAQNLSKQDIKDLAAYYSIQKGLVLIKHN